MEWKRQPGPQHTTCRPNRILNRVVIAGLADGSACQPTVALLILASVFAPATAGQSTCAPCHRQAKTQAASGMAKALERGEDCSILKENRRLTFTDHQFTYKIERDGDRSLYSVSNGQDTVTVPIPWAFGLGAPGQTYVLQLDGKWYESRVSFYKVLDGLDFTLGARKNAPRTLIEAMGRELPRQEVAACFDCHSTNSVHGGDVDFGHLLPGVLCEACHGSAAKHVVSPGKESAMPKLARLSTEEMFELCGRCHRTWATIAANGPRGVENVRFQPFRLTNSKCYDAADQRISCVACHDPHSSVEKPASFYQSKCVACHSPNAKTQTKLCPVSKEDCVRCHMPKYEIPDTHHKFTDHEIRIVRAGSPYPH
jgi:Cytochrome c3